MRAEACVAVCTLVFDLALALNTAYIESQREVILLHEAHLTPGGNITLTEKEDRVNTCIMQHKFHELDNAFDNPQYFNFSHHFFEYKNRIPHSKVYKIIKDMPKGALLHVHDMGILSPDYLISITYKPNLYVCLDKNDIQLKFANSIENNSQKFNCKWEKVADLRHAAANVTAFDAGLSKHFTLVVDDPETAYPSTSESWAAFNKYFRTVGPMLTYRPVWEQYFYDALKQFKEQNIMYVEIRSVLPQLYELDGTTYSQLVTAKSFKKVINRFKKDYSDFLGLKLIFAPSRNVNREQVNQYIVLAKQIKADIPEIFAGFDLVGQEDTGAPLIEFAKQLTEAAGDLNYFFHAGETNWYGTRIDTNLIDAILLGAKRIGHGYALTKHPLITEQLMKQDIGLEVNVISNVVLSLVKDIRNHPLSVYLAQGLPVILSSDDPGAWEADPLSEDFYVAFVGAASKLADLRLLKGLALNSLKYSTFTPAESEAAFAKFNIQWNNFVDNFDCALY